MPKRLLKDVQVLFISLVDKGANKRTVIWKNAAETAPTMGRTIPIRKIDEEKRLVYGIVYAPDEEDTQGDAMTGPEIEKMAYGFMKAGRTRNVDQQHDYEADEGFVAESWLIRKGDPMFPEEPEGAWAVAIKVENDDAWKKVKNGEITGLSMGGFGKAEEVEKNAKGKKMEKNNKIMEALSKFFRGSSEVDINKDFNDEYKRNSIANAIWALHDALDKVMNDETVDDKMAAMKESVNQFLNFLDNLQGEPVMKEQKNTEGIKKQEPPEKEATAQPEEQKALEQVLQKLEAIEQRLEQVEKATPGKQSADGRDEEPEKVEKGFKGLRII